MAKEKEIIDVQELLVEIDKQLEDRGLGPEWRKVYLELHTLCRKLGASVYDMAYGKEDGTPIMLDFRIILDPEGHYTQLLEGEPPTNAFH